MFNNLIKPSGKLSLAFVVAALLLSSVITDRSLAQEANDQLRWRFQTGDRFNVTLVKTGNVKTQVDTRIRKVEIESQLEFEWNVIKAGENETTIEQTLKKVVLESGAPGDVSEQRLSYDSSNVVYKKGISNTVANQLKPLTGLKYQFVITDRGEIKSVMVAEDQLQILEAIPATLQRLGSVLRRCLMIALGRRSKCWIRN